MYMYMYICIWQQAALQVRLSFELRCGGGMAAVGEALETMHAPLLTYPSLLPLFPPFIQTYSLKKNENRSGSCVLLYPVQLYYYLLLFFFFTWLIFFFVFFTFLAAFSTWCFVEPFPYLSVLLSFDSILQIKKKKKREREL